MSVRGIQSEIVNDVIQMISQPSFKRESKDIEHVLPWLQKRSLLLQRQELGVLRDIVKNCSFVTCNYDDLVIKQGDRGDCFYDEMCFYIVLRGTASVYIDSKMTGDHDDASSIGQSSAKSREKKKKSRKTPPPPSSEDSELSQVTQSEKPEAEVEAEEENSSENHPETIEGTDDGSDGLEPRRKVQPKKLALLDRSKFGRHIVTYGTGQAFGEIALVNHDSYRNATVIADQDMDLMVIGQDLFDRSLRAEQESRYEEIRNFIDGHPFFCMLTNKLKKLLEMSIRKETYIFDTNIVKQGDPAIGLHFITSGQAKISIEPKKHKQQYIHHWPFEAGVDALSIEFEHLREVRRAAILRKYEDPSVWETKPEELVIRRTEGYAAIEKLMQEKHINLCTVQTKEVLGDVETLLGLNTYMYTVRCTSNTECFILDTKNWDRLIGKKNNSSTVDVMREYVISKLSTRMSMRNADLIPFLGYLYQKLTEQNIPPTRKPEPFKMSKTLPDRDTEMLHLLQYFREGKAELIRPLVPGFVYYKEIMHEKAKNREKNRKNTSNETVKLRPLKKAMTRRQPRSMMQIRESLRQMLESEVIQFENEEKKRKLKLKSRKDRLAKQQQQQQHGIHLESIPTPRTPQSQLTDRNNGMRSPNPSTLNAIKQGPKKVEEAANSIPEPSNAIKQLVNKKKQNSKQTESTTILVTEMGKKDTDLLTLPAIREERTQEEIKLPNNKLDGVGMPPRQHTSASSFIDDTCVTTEPAGNHTVSNNASHNGSVSKPKFSSRNLATLNGSKQNDSGENVSKFPKIVVTKENGKSPVPNSTGNGETSEEPEHGASKWKTAMTFVNERIQQRLTKALMEEETEYKDYETSEPSLKLLEKRIQAFHVQYGDGSKTKNLPHLKRFKLDAGGSEDVDGDSPSPRPGGKVWIKKKACMFAHSEYAVKDHKHVRYQMVESIPEFDQVSKSKVILQQFLKSMNVQQ